MLGLNLTSMLGLADIKSFAKEVLKPFSGRTNFLEQMFLDLVTAFCIVWKNQES